MKKEKELKKKKKKRRFLKNEDQNWKGRQLKLQRMTELQ